MRDNHEFADEAEREQHDAWLDEALDAIRSTFSRHTAEGTCAHCLAMELMLEVLEPVVREYGKEAALGILSAIEASLDDFDQLPPQLGWIDTEAPQCQH